MIKLRILVVILLLSLFETKPQAQERIQTIENSVSLLSVQKGFMVSYLTDHGFRFDNKTRSGDMIVYAKQMQYGKCRFSFSVEHGIVGAVSWNEDTILGQDILSEIRDKGFQISLNMVNRGELGDIKMFSCKNYSRNLMITVIFRPEDTYLTINLGKIDTNKPVVKQILQNNLVDETTADQATTKYVVISQKSYFYNTNADGRVGQRRQAYLVEGEKITATKEKDAYVYCSFTNSTTKKTSIGWICKMDIEELSSDSSVIQTNSIEPTSPYYSLTKLDSYPDVSKVYYNPVITNLLKKIMGADYNLFVKSYLASAVVGDVYVRHNVLYIRSFIAHSATVNATFFLDLKENKCFLYWNTFDKSYNDLLKTYGDVHLSSGIVNFIQLWKIDNKDFMDENGVQLLDDILKYQ